MGRSTDRNWNNCLLKFTEQLNQKQEVGPDCHRSTEMKTKEYAKEIVTQSVRQDEMRRPICLEKEKSEKKGPDID